MKLEIYLHISTILMPKSGNSIHFPLFIAHTRTYYIIRLFTRVPGAFSRQTGERPCPLRLRGQLRSSPEMNPKSCTQNYEVYETFF